MSTSKVLTQECWYAFVSRNLLKFVQSLSTNEILKSTSELLEQQEKMAKMPPKDANKLLRHYISDAAVKTFSARFRAEKYRKSKNKKTVQLTEDTHKRLLAFKELLNADTVDEVLDYALSKKYEQDYDVTNAKETLADFISDISNFNFDGLLQRLTLNDKYKLYHIIKSVHQEAWLIREQTNSDSPYSQQEAMSSNQYMISMMMDEELAKEIEFYELISGAS